MVKTWQIILTTIVIFLAGLITGGVVAVRVVQYMMARNRPVPQLGPQWIRQKILPQLELSDAERKKINPILRRTADELQRLRRETVLSVSLADDHMQEDISRELTPEQRTQFEALMTELKNRVQRENEERARKNFMQRLGSAANPSSPEGPVGPQPPAPQPAK